MNEKSKKAKQLFENGHNCAQAVICAFADEINMNEETAYMLASSFGGGIGRLREVCGAVSGIAMVAGLLYGYKPSDSPDKKPEHYALIQELAHKFLAENGSIICRDLLPEDDANSTSPTPEKRTTEYYKKRPCAELVECAAKIMEDYINSRKN